jgi:hypothetical protein
MIEHYVAGTMRIRRRTNILLNISKVHNQDGTFLPMIQ